jgi:RNA recognition motif-containing protein
MSAAPGYTIHVSGLAPETTEEKLHDFFSFCGKLVSVKKDANQADITFEKLSAMRTSL